MTQGFFGDKKIRLLLGEHGAESLEIYIRLICKIYEDNGYFLVWDDDEDYALCAEESGTSETKLRAIMATLLRRSLLCKLTLWGNAMSQCGEGFALAEAGNGNNLIPSVNVITSRGIQRRYFGAVRETRIKAAAEGHAGEYIWDTHSIAYKVYDAQYC